MAKKYTGQVFLGANDEWYWRVTSKNGNIVASGGEGYKNRSTAVKMLENVTALSNNSDQYEVTVEATAAEAAKLAKIALAKK